jgi:hypothetical protein
MNHIHKALIALCVATFSLGALAQSADEHKGHHPDGATPPAVSPQKGAANAMSTGSMAKMDQHMKAMQAMHEKMASAKTPEERQALMADNMKMMQDGMAMMKEMGGMSGMSGMQSGKGMGGNMAERQQMMEKRMDMMQSMMQMMMDCMPPSPTK